MKLKAAIRYQSAELVQCTAVFCLIIGAVIAVTFLVAAFSEGVHMMMPTMGALPYAVMIMLAVSVFSGDMRFLLQMGLTRAQVLASTVASFAAACLFLALVEGLCAAFIPFWPHVQSLFLMSYGIDQGPVLDFLFMFLGCAALSGAGLALAALQMRFGTRRVVLFLCAFALAVFVVLPYVLPPSVVSPKLLFDAVQTAFGFGEGGSLASPFILFAAVAAAGVAVAWIAVRRIEVR